MKILLDECVPKGIQKSFPQHECWTVPRAGFTGTKNGALLKLAEEAGFEVLLTVDQGIAYQQNLKSRTIAILLLRPRSNKLQDIVPHVEICLRALQSIRPGQIMQMKPAASGQNPQRSKPNRFTSVLFLANRPPLLLN